MERGVPIRSVSRSLAVLQAINSTGSLSLTEISRAVDLPYATTARLVMTLIHEGMIEQEPGRKNYRPTALVQSLASGYHHHSHLGAAARPHIVALTEKHGCPVTVSSRLGLNMILRECTHSLSHFTLAPYFPGFVYPLADSAAGLAYLAFSSEQELQMARSALSEAIPGDQTALSLASDAALEDIRRHGFATRGRNRFTVPEGKNSAIAAPIFENGRVCGALALIFLASSMRMEKAVALYAQDVVDTARAVSWAMDRSQGWSLRLSA